MKHEREPNQDYNPGNLTIVQCTCGWTSAQRTNRKDKLNEVFTHHLTRSAVDDALDYVRACAAALRDRTLTVYDITSVCPECREYVDSSDPAHVTAPAGIVDGIAVLIGCEGYHVINPARVGLDDTGWEDWRPIDERGPDSEYDPNPYSGYEAHSGSE